MERFRIPEQRLEQGLVRNPQVIASVVSGGRNPWKEDIMQQPPDSSGTGQAPPVVPGYQSYYPPASTGCVWVGLFAIHFPIKLVNGEY